MNFVRVSIFVLAVLLLQACATPRGSHQLHHLNNPSRSVQAVDVANLLPPRQIPYETIDKNGITVSYNLFVAGNAQWPMYRLTLILRNNTGLPQTLKPSVSLIDSSGYVIQPYEYHAVTSRFAAMAGTVAPSVPNQTEPSTYQHSGMVINPATGSQYYYSGTTTTASGGFYAGLASGLAQGIARNAAAQAAKTRDEGTLGLRWANLFWMKEVYELPPGTAGYGVLLFPESAIDKLPFRVVVDVGGQNFEFRTIGR